MILLSIIIGLALAVLYAFFCSDNYNSKEKKREVAKVNNTIEIPSEVVTTSAPTHIDIVEEVTTESSKSSKENDFFCWEEDNDLPELETNCPYAVHFGNSTCYCSVVGCNKVCTEKNYVGCSLWKIQFDDKCRGVLVKDPSRSIHFKDYD